MPSKASPGGARFRDRACPRDHTPLQAEKVKVPGPDVTIDKCPKCSGVFLDKNELLRLTGDAKLNKYLRDDVALDSDSQLLCPHCGGIMDVEHDVAGVDVEVCLSCYGLWLDRGELQALTARKNRESIALTADKQAELARADRAQSRGKGAAVGGAKGARRLGREAVSSYSRALDELVRRYL